MDTGTADITLPEESAAEPARGPRWPYVLVATFLALGLVVLLLWPVKVPYVAFSPGQVEQVADLITIDGAETYQPTGDYYLLTVGLRDVNVFEYIEAQFDEEVDLYDREVIRPRGVSREEQKRTNLELMDGSIEAALFVALGRLGYDVGFEGDGVVVLDVVQDSPSDGVLREGDLVAAVEGTSVQLTEEAAGIIRSFEVGDTITLSIVRDEQEMEVQITLVPHPDIEGAPMVGVLLDTINLTLDIPIDVEVDSRNIGGPSAGMMYAVSLIDLLTPEDLTKGHRIAGTGTISFDETVGAIGGVRQKVYAARAVGAEIVFVPEANYEEALTAQGDDIQIVSVGTLQDVLDFLETLEPAPEVVAAP
jgi:PDZ domain-containing protein